VRAVYTTAVQGAGTTCRALTYDKLCALCLLRACVQVSADLWQGMQSSSTASSGVAAAAGATAGAAADAAASTTR
jgi:hypothetical protein